MTVFVDHQDLNLPAAHVARGHALSLLAEADSAMITLAGGAADDEEAVHNYRVTLRRLRTWLRCYAEVMGVPEKLQRRLNKRAKASNRARDGEVSIGLLRGFARELPSTSRAVLAGHIDQLERELVEHRQVFVATALEGWPREHRKLAKALVNPPLEVTLEPFARVLARTLTEAADALDRDTHEQSTPKELHRTRVSVKSLRYLLEPLQRLDPCVERLVRKLRKLQDLYGHFTDLEMLLTFIAKSLERIGEQQAARLLELSACGEHDAAAYAALRRSDPAPALVAIVDIASTRHEELFEQLIGHSQRGLCFTREIERVIATGAEPAAVAAERPR
jgi:CHAD domain-containing protein